MSSYNIYYCQSCNNYMDATHAFILSLKIQCPSCSVVMEHNGQYLIPDIDIDIDAVYEQQGWSS